MVGTAPPCKTRWACRFQLIGNVVNMNKIEFWVYTNWTEPHARVHLDHCSHCNYGEGKNGCGKIYS